MLVTVVLQIMSNSSTVHYHVLVSVNFTNNIFQSFIFHESSAAQTSYQQSIWLCTANDPLCTANDSLCTANEPLCTAIK